VSNAAGDGAVLGAADLLTMHVAASYMVYRGWTMGTASGDRLTGGPIRIRQIPATIPFQLFVDSVLRNQIQKKIELLVPKHLYTNFGQGASYLVAKFTI